MSQAPDLGVSWMRRQCEPSSRDAEEEEMTVERAEGLRHHEGIEDDPGDEASIEDELTEASGEDTPETIAE